MLKKVRGMVRRWFIRHDCYHGLPLLAFLIIYLIWFHIIEVISTQRNCLEITTPLDRWIPFCEVFVIPYYSWFLFVGFSILYFYFKDREAFDELQTFLMIGMTVFLLVSTFIPNRQPLRLMEFPRNNIFTKIVAFLWKSDTPTNVWPSIHVFNTTSIAVVYWRAYPRHPEKKWFRTLIPVWSILIIMSTVLIKQHSIFDVVTAFALAVVCDVYIYTFGHVWHFRKYDERWKKKPYWDREPAGKARA